MSRHLNSKNKDISSLVLMSGNPERVKWAAKIFLTNIKLVNTNRGALIYSGYYKNIFISFATSGMGMPSISIYSTELYRDYNVETIIRIGTAGAYGKDINIFDIFNLNETYTESNIGEYLGYPKLTIKPNSKLFNLINSTSEKLKLKIKNGRSHSTDIFYQNFEFLKRSADLNNLDLCEMESYALWIIAEKFNKSAATILLISDILFHIENKKTKSTFKERITKTKKCWKLGLETLIKFNKK